MTQLSPKAAAQVMMRLDPAYRAPGSDLGTPAVRFASLMAELEKRLPDPQPLSAELPEPRYLAQIDEAIRLLNGARFHLTGEGKYIDREEITDGIDKLIGPWSSWCRCGAKPRGECPGLWEPGCDLGANEAHARQAPQQLSSMVDSAFGFRYVAVKGYKIRGLTNKITQEQYDNLTPLGKKCYRKIEP